MLKSVCKVWFGTYRCICYGSKNFGLGSLHDEYVGLSCATPKFYSAAPYRFDYRSNTKLMYKCNYMMFWLVYGVLWVQLRLMGSLLFEIVKCDSVTAYTEDRSTRWNLRSSRIGPIGCPETSVRNYHSTLRDIPEERRSHLYRRGSLKSRKVLPVAYRRSVVTE
jgi:hypothetical protein